MGPDEDALFGQGWQPAGGDGRPFRGSAEMALALARSGAVRLELRAKSSGDAPERLGLAVNGQSIGTRPLSTAPQSYVFDVPRGAFVEGANRITINAEGSQPAGVAVSDIVLDLLEK